MKMNYEKYSDARLFALMHDSKRESEAAFAELYSRYSQKVFSFCFRMLGSKEDAKDVFQETFINFFNSREQYRGMEYVFSFLITTARNLCYNHKRDNKTSVNIDDHILSTTDVDYEQKELLEIIAQSLELLSLEYKEVFILRLYHGLSYKEISQITGDTTTSTKSKFFRAKTAIKKILNPYLIELSEV